MPSADQVPVKSSHSTMRWHLWVVLIAGSTGSALRAVRPPNFHITPAVQRDLKSRARQVPCSAAFSARMQDMELHSEGGSRRLQGARKLFGKSWTGRIDEYGNAGRRGHQFAQQFQPLGATSMFKLVTPVRFPPGRCRLATSPSWTGSVAVSKTIGIIAVAAFAATVEGVPDATITVT